MLGETVSHYMILEKLGQGGMGEVYRARDSRLNRDIALKVLPNSLATDRQRRARLKREAEAAAALRHPGIVTVHALEQTDDLLFITMELVEGETLDELQRRRELTPTEVLDFSSQLASAVAAAHRAGVVHRDLKPSNVMITPGGRVMVLDFGLASIDSRARDPERTAVMLTEAGAVVGTVPYMAPEQLRGEQAGPASDVFSLGILLTELATGRRPFSGGTAAEMHSSILRDDPALPRSIRPELDPGMDVVIDRCLMKDASRRYPSAVDLAEALNLLKSREESGAHTPPPTVPRGSRSRTILIVAVVVVSAAIAMVKLLPPGDSTPGPTIPTSDRIVLAVLPFDDESTAENDYFAEGMTEELLTRLSMVDGLDVISRSSAAHVATMPLTTAEIGVRLGADYIVEGSVRRARGDHESDRMRITTRLIRAEDDTQVWAQPYDRVLEDVFAIQSEIALAVVKKLELTLGHAQAVAFEYKPTQDLEAYDAYVEGVVRFSQYRFDEARAAFAYAVELDSTFGDAWAELSLMETVAWFAGRIRTHEQRQKAYATLAQAEAHAPDRPATVLARGYAYYQLERDYERAIECFNRVGELAPGSWKDSMGRAHIYRRQGRFTMAVEEFQKAIRLNPVQAALQGELAGTYRYLGQIDEIQACVDRAQQMNPDGVIGFWSLITAGWWITGDLDLSRDIFDRIPADLEHRFEFDRVWHEVLTGNYDEALRRMKDIQRPWHTGTMHAYPKELLHAWVLEAKGDLDEARGYYEIAVDSLRASIARVDDNERTHSALGLAHLGAGNHQDALASSRRAVELLPLEIDFLFGPRYQYNLALVEARTGHLEESMQRLKALLELHNMVTIVRLKGDPLWREPRRDPRFQDLLSVEYVARDNS